MALRRAFSAGSGSLTSAVRAIRTSAAGLRRRSLAIGGARCSRCAAIIMRKAERVGCMARVGASRGACPPSRGLRRHELRRPSASHDSPSRRGVSGAGNRRRVWREGRHALPGILRGQHPQPGLSINHLTQVCRRAFIECTIYLYARPCNLTRDNPVYRIGPRQAEVRHGSRPVHGRPSHSCWETVIVCNRSGE